MSYRFTLDNRVGNTEIRERVGKCDDHQRNGQQTKLVMVKEARQHRHLRRAKSNNDNRRNRGPFRAANGFSRKLMIVPQ